VTQPLDICVMAHAKDPERPRRARDGEYLCHGHHLELVRLIAEMPAVHDDLERANGPGGPRPPGSGGGISIDDAVAGHRSHIAGVIASWARLVVDIRGVTAPREDIYSMCAFLSVHADWCAQQRWVDEMLSELRQLAGRARGITDTPARVCDTGQRCLIHDGGERCEGTITLIVRGDDWAARCSSEECTERQDASPYLKVRGRWVAKEGVFQLARIVGIPCSDDVLRQWKSRRRIKSREEGGATWYELASVQTYLSNRRQQEAARERVIA
jgi:hypothetical protein